MFADGVTVVANNTQDLLDGGSAVPISRDEKNDPVGGSTLVWTGTLEDGTVAPINCMDWGVVLNMMGLLYREAEVSGDARRGMMRARGMAICDVRSAVATLPRIRARRRRSAQ